MLIGYCEPKVMTKGNNSDSQLYEYRELELAKPDSNL